MNHQRSATLICSNNLASSLIEAINDRLVTSTNPLEHLFQVDGQKPRKDCIYILWVDCKLWRDIHGN